MSISIKTFQKKYKHSINRGLSFDWISKIRKYGDFDFDVFLPSIGKNLQRDLVWTLEQKRAMIITMLRNQRVPNIAVVQNKGYSRAKDEKYQWQVIDGKQRLTTAFSYIDGEFSIVVDGQEYYYNDLPDDCQGQINSYDFRWDVHYSYPEDPISDETKIDLFEEINFFGTPQDINHLQNLRGK